MIERRNGKERRGAKPVFTSAPRIVQATVGLRATFTPGAVTGAAVISHRWAVAGRAVGVVNGDFTPTAATVGKALTLRQTAQNQWGSITATSAPVSIGPAVASPPPAPPPMPPTGATYSAAGQVGGNLADAAEWMRSAYANLIDSMRGFTPIWTSYCDLGALTLNEHGFPTTVSTAILQADGALKIGEVYDAYFAGPGEDDAIAPHQGCDIVHLSATRAKLTITGEVATIRVRGNLTDLEIIPEGYARGTKWRADYLAYLDAVCTGLRILKGSGAEHYITKPGAYRFAYTGTAPTGCGGGQVLSDVATIAGRMTGTLTLAPHASAPVLYLDGSVVPEGLVFERVDDAGYVLAAFADTSRVVVRQTQNLFARRPRIIDRLANVYEGKIERGMPMEDQIDLANALYALNPKNNHLAVAPPILDDAELRPWLEMFRDRLNPNIVLRPSRRNEDWNHVYPYELELRKTATALGNAAPQYLNYDGIDNPNHLRSRLAIYKTHLMGMIAKEVFGADFGKRVRIGFEYQVGGEEYLGDGLQFLAAKHSLEFVHDVSAANYTNVAPEWLAAERRSPIDIYAQLEDNAFQGLPKMRAFLKRGRAIAAAFGKGSYCYESNTHIHWQSPDIAAFFESPYCAHHLRNIIATQAALGIAPDYHFNVGVGGKSYSARSPDGNRMWFATDSITALRPRAQALVEMQAAPMPAIDAELQVPGVLPCAKLSWHDSMVWNERSTGRMQIINGQLMCTGRVEDPIRRVWGGFHAQHAGEYVFTLPATAEESTPTAVILDGVVIHSMDVAGGSPVMVKAAPRAPVRVTLTAGFHALEIVATPAPGVQWGIGDALMQRAEH